MGCAAPGDVGGTSVVAVGPCGHRCPVEPWPECLPSDAGMRSVESAPGCVETDWSELTRRARCSRTVHRMDGFGVRTRQPSGHGIARRVMRRAAFGLLLPVPSRALAAADLVHLDPTAGPWARRRGDAPVPVARGCRHGAVNPRLTHRSARAVRTGEPPTTEGAAIRLQVRACARRCGFETGLVVARPRRSRPGCGRPLPRGVPAPPHWRRNPRHPTGSTRHPPRWAPCVHTGLEAGPPRSTWG